MIPRLAHGEVCREVIVAFKSASDAQAAHQAVNAADGQLHSMQRLHESKRSEDCKL